METISKNGFWSPAESVRDLRQVKAAVKIKPGEYNRYFEDSAKGCAVRLENQHSVLI